MKAERLNNPGIMKAKEGSFYIAVSAVIVNPAREILITRRSLQHNHRPGEWELVTGRINKGETDMITALKREVKEEVGIEVDIIAPFRTFYFEHGGDKKPHFGVNFYCSYMGNQEIVLNMQEQDGFQWVAPQIALGIIQDPSAKDAVLAYQKFREHFS